MVPGKKKMQMLVLQLDNTDINSDGQRGKS